MLCDVDCNSEHVNGKLDLMSQHIMSIAVPHWHPAPVLYAISVCFREDGEYLQNTHSHSQF